ncbi:hypothetical protein GC170_14445 [bacterium]|nr:hypothetical protein [bacterium]
MPDQESFTVGQLTNAGFTLTVNGRAYRFAELTVRHYGLLEDHLRRIQPKAADVYLDMAKKLGLSPDQIAAFMIPAYERDLYWPLPVDSVPAMQMLMTDALARNDFVRMALEVHQPGITAAEARDVAESLTRMQLRRVIGWGLGGRDIEPGEDQETNPLGERKSA